MATAREDAKTQELNLIFKSLGERGKEGDVWKEFTEHTLCYLLQQTPEFINKAFANGSIDVVFQLYGSAAKDLKSQATDDIGDLDIVIIPKSEALFIHDEMIEYLPQHPLHVRIKGRDHPLLQSCLVEDKPYVATSAIKNFHPAIYGTSAPHMINNLTRSIQIGYRENWGQFVTEWKNKEDGQALQVNGSQSFGPVSGEMKRTNNPQNLVNCDPAEWDWLAKFLTNANGFEYSREHADILGEFMTFANDIQMSLHERGLLGQPQALPGFVQELISSERVKQLRERVVTIQQSSHNQNESELGGEHLAEAEQHSNDQSVMPGSCHGNETGSKKDKVLQEAFLSTSESFLTPKNSRDSHNTAENLGTTLSQSTMGESSESPYQSAQHTMPKKVSETGVNEKKEQGQNEDGTDESGSESINTAKPPFAEKGEPSHSDFKSVSGEKNILLEHILGPFSQESKAPWKETDVKDSKKATIAGGADLVPALRCPGWPRVAEDWIKRKRKWPSPDVINKVVQEGFHLVVKPPKDGGNPKCDFRISFSHAEYLLSQAMNDIQRECYRCLKKFHRAFLKDPKGLVTFHLKNLLLQTIEETGAELWIESNRVECVMKLFGNLSQALTKKELPHFFVRSYNLFSEDYIDDPEILDVLARKVEKIMENPMQSAKQLIQKEASAVQAPLEEKSILSNGLAVKTASKADGFDSHMVLPGTLKKDDTRPVSSSSRQSYRFHDLKDIYLASSQELTAMAFNADDLTIESLDPLKRSLVGDLKEMIKTHNLNAAEFRRMFEANWSAIYWKVSLNPEPNMSLRMLDAIQGVVETWKYLLKQDDFAPENAEALAERLLNPDPDADPFDLTNLLPAGIGTQFVTRFFNSLTPSSADETKEVNLDKDIPLD